MLRFTRAVGYAVLLTSIIAACGSSDEPGSTHGDAGNAGSAGQVRPDPEAADAMATPVEAGLPNIDIGQDMATLSAQELAELCDWDNQLQGGYGLVTDCGGGNSVQNDSSQAACVTQGFKFRCVVTVGEFETCRIAQAPSHGCDFIKSACHALICQ